MPNAPPLALGGGLKNLATQQPKRGQLSLVASRVVQVQGHLTERLANEVTEVPVDGPERFTSQLCQAKSSEACGDGLRRSADEVPLLPRSRVIASQKRFPLPRKLKTGGQDSATRAGMVTDVDAAE